MNLNSISVVYGELK